MLQLQRSLYVVPFALLAVTLGQGMALFHFRPPPLYASELNVIRFLQDETEPETVILMGPSHQLPWYYMFDRRSVFVPNYGDWERLLPFIDYFGAEYCLLDQELYHRRKVLFAPYASWEKGQGLQLNYLPPRMEPVLVDPAFVLFRIVPAQADLQNP